MIQDTAKNKKGFLMIKSVIFSIFVNTFEIGDNGMRCGMDKRAYFFEAIQAKSKMLNTFSGIKNFKNFRSSFKAKASHNVVSHSTPTKDLLLTAANKIKSESHPYTHIKYGC